MKLSRWSVRVKASIKRFASRTRSICDQRAGFGATEM
jgi:hypothetical protein